MPGRVSCSMSIIIRRGRAESEAEVNFDFPHFLRARLVVVDFLNGTGRGPVIRGIRFCFTGTQMQTEGRIELHCELGFIFIEKFQI